MQTQKQQKVKVSRKKYYDKMTKKVVKDRDWKNGTLNCQSEKDVKTVKYKSKIVQLTGPSIIRKFKSKLKKPSMFLGNNGNSPKLLFFFVRGKSKP